MFRMCLVHQQTTIANPSLQLEIQLDNTHRADDDDFDDGKDTLTTTDGDEIMDKCDNGGFSLHANLSEQWCTESFMFYHFNPLVLVEIAQPASQ